MQMEYIFGFLGLVFGGIGGAVFAWLTNRKAAKLQFNLNEVIGIEDLVERIQKAASRTVADGAKIAALEYLVKVRDDEIDRYERRQEEILVNHGRMEEREAQCAAEIKEIKKRLVHYDTIVADYDTIKSHNKSLNDRVAQQAAIIEKAQREGQWKPEPSGQHPAASTE